MLQYDKLVIWHWRCVQINFFSHNNPLRGTTCLCGMPSVRRSSLLKIPHLTMKSPKRRDVSLWSCYIHTTQFILQSMVPLVCRNKLIFKTQNSSAAYLIEGGCYTGIPRDCVPGNTCLQIRVGISAVLTGEASWLSTSVIKFKHFL